LQNRFLRPFLRRSSLKSHWAKSAAHRAFE
jgi:hypothetical protein